jgi:ABC-2 type transport system permease protein
MRKILVIARRDYLAAVRTKAFIIGLVMLPVLMAGMIGLLVLLQKMADVDDKPIAVIDRTPGGKLCLALPPGIPWWQPPLGMVLMLLATALCTYAAGRIFRVGILMVGRGPNLRDLVRWVFGG